MAEKTQEFIIDPKNGFLMLGLMFLVMGILMALGIYIIDSAPEYSRWGGKTQLVGGIEGYPAVGWGAIPILAGVASFFLFIAGFFVLGPNQGKAFTLFGKYYGSVKVPGYHWINPFASGSKINLKSRNFNTAELKVNDKAGNPIIIGAVIVTKIENTYKAIFDVQEVHEFVENQAESALRDVCREYVYDAAEDDDVITLRHGTDEVIEKLTADLQERVVKAGVTVEDARITSLAYSTEVAAAMLQRQQAEALISARKKIVEGSLAIVTETVESLDKQGIKLNKADKAKLVSNLLVVMVSDAGVTPTVELT